MNLKANDNKERAIPPVIKLPDGHRMYGCNIDRYAYSDVEPEGLWRVSIYSIHKTSVEKDRETTSEFTGYTSFDEALAALCALAWNIDEFLKQLRESIKC